MSSRRAKNSVFKFDLLKIGIFFILLSLICALVFFHSVIFEELKYIFDRPTADAQPIVSRVPAPMDQKKVIVAADPEFSIVIPKIGANSKVIPNVDPQNSYQYQVSLSQGVAHAKGTSLPGEEGNVFLFAHSSDNFYNANRYNAIFYLLTKLEHGDFVYLVYKEKVYKYEVRETKIVEKTDVRYIGNLGSGQTVTLMTCWPAGTSMKRFVVVADLVKT